MKLKRYLLLVCLLCPVFAHAQRPLTIVGGVVTANVTDYSDFAVSLNANVTGVTLSKTVTPATGYQVTMRFVQDATGSRTVTFGGNITTSCSVNATALAVTICRWQYTASGDTWADASSSGSSSPAVWKDADGVIIPYVATDAETQEEATWLYESGCIILTTLPKCWKVWHTVGWSTSGMSYAECPSLTNGQPGLCTRLNNGAIFSTTGSGATGGRARGYVLHQGATYYLFICNATCSALDMWSSATGGNDFVLVQASVVAIGGVGTWDHTQVLDPFVWVEGTTWKLIYSGQTASSFYALGYATCTSSCTGGAATWTKDAGNPFIGPDAVNLGGYGNADLHIVNNTYWIWAHSSGTLATLLPSDIYSWTCGNAGAAQKPTSCTQSPLGVPAFGRQTTDEGASTLVGQVADVDIVERTDLNPTKVFMFFESLLDGTQQGGMSHLKYAVAEMSLQNLVASTQNRAPLRENLSINSLAVSVHASPGLGMVSVGNSNSSLGFKANNPTCNLQYMAFNANADLGVISCNEYFSPGAPPTLSRVNTSLTAGRWQVNPSNSNVLSGLFLGHTNIGGVETFPLQGYFDANGNSFDVLPLLVSGGQAPTLTGTGACATFAAQTGASVGSFQCTGTTGAATVTMTFPTITSGGLTMHGWNCDLQDETTRANLLQQTSHTATTCVLTATTVTQNDVVVFKAHGF